MTLQYIKYIIVSVIYLLVPFCQISGQIPPTIDKSEFTVSTNNITFGSDSGVKYITVTSKSGNSEKIDWTIEQNPQGWINVKKDGDRVRVSVESYPKDSKRTHTFILIAKNNKKQKITVTQKGAEIKQEEGGVSPIASRKNAVQSSVPANKKFIPTLSVSPSFVSFGVDGGTRMFTVSANEGWSIAQSSIPSGGSLSRNGNNIVLKVDPNKQTFAQSGYFIVKTSSKQYRVSFTQDALRFSISSTDASFSSSGSSKTFTVDANSNWNIKSRPVYNWSSLSRDGDKLTLKVDNNYNIESRSDAFVLASGSQEIRVNIQQRGADPYLIVNGSKGDTRENFSEYGGSYNISVSSNEPYTITSYPYWCSISNRTSYGFTVQCSRNKTCDTKSGYITVKTRSKTCNIYLNQNVNWSKYQRRRNGGWVNMAIGFEGAYSLCGDQSWYANAIVGMRIGNYRDVVQFEIGLTPGLVAYEGYDPDFQIPAYASLKLSTRRGGFYFKVGGTYKLLKPYDFDSDYTLRAGFGSAWKHFEWDWAYIQYSPQKDNHYYDGYYYYEGRSSTEWMAGMRFVWYITR